MSKTGRKIFSSPLGKFYHVKLDFASQNKEDCHELIPASLFCNFSKNAALHKGCTWTLYHTAEFKPCDLAVGGRTWRGTFWKKRTQYYTHKFWGRVFNLRKPHACHIGFRSFIPAAERTRWRIDPAWHAAFPRCQFHSAACRALSGIPSWAWCAFYISYRLDRRSCQRSLGKGLWSDFLFHAAGDRIVRHCADHPRGSGTYRSRPSPTGSKTVRCIDGNAHLSTDLFFPRFRYAWRCGPSVFTDQCSTADCLWDRGSRGDCGTHCTGFWHCRRSLYGSFIKAGCEDSADQCACMGA